jgi:homoserine O-acetyltransferase
VITIADMVEAQRRLIDHLGIAKLHAVIGISMGGMQTFEWMVRFPDRMARAVPIIGSPRLTTQDLLLWQAELSAIEGGAANAMETVNAIHQFALYTPDWRRTNSGNWILLRESLGKPGRVTAADWASQLRAMMSHNIGAFDEAAPKVRARSLVVIATHDLMVNPEPARTFARRLGADVLELTGDCGHMATSCQATEFAASVQRFLSRK